MPERIQLSRRKGWRMPEGAILVARPSRWGNPFEVGANVLKLCAVTKGDVLDYGGRETTLHDFDLPLGLTAEQAVAAYRLVVESLISEPDWANPHLDDIAHAIEMRSLVQTLRGHDLACWCPLDQPCHADVLLELANA